MVNKSACWCNKRWVQRQVASSTLGKLLEFLGSSFAHSFIHLWTKE